MYSWQVDYIAALLETNDSNVAHLIYKAIAAIEQRLLSPVEVGGEEEHSLQQAQKVLLIVKDEKLPPMK
jgi:hypothetical protein